MNGALDYETKILLMPKKIGSDQRLRFLVLTNRGAATEDRNEKVGTNRSWVVWYVELFIIRYAYSIQFHQPFPIPHCCLLLSI